MEKLKVDGRSDLPGGGALWEQFPQDAEIVQLGQNLVRVHYPRNDTIGRLQAYSIDFRLVDGCAVEDRNTFLA